MVATRMLWRYLAYVCEQGLSWSDCQTAKLHREEGHDYCRSELETTEAGERCDWAAGGVYESLGWVIDLTK